MVLTVVLVITSLWIAFGIFLRINVRELSEKLSKRFPKEESFIQNEKSFSMLLVVLWLLSLGSVRAIIFFGVLL